MAVIASEVLVREAQIAHRQRRFAGGRATVGIAPNTIVLKRSRIRKSLDTSSCVTYQLAITNNGHYRKRLDAMGLRVERRGAAIVAKDNIRVNISVEVRDAVGLYSVLKSRLSLPTGVVGASAPGSVGTIAVDIHVVVAAIPLQKDDVGNVATVRSTATKGARQLLGARSRLIPDL